MKPKVTRFEDIDAWKKARELVKTIYKATAGGDFSRDFGLKDQIRRAAVSVMSNVAEGFERGGNRQFQQFLSVAKGSAGEVKSQLYVALDAGHIDQNDFNYIYQLADETGRLIGGFLSYLSKSEHRGSKFRTRNP